MNEETVRHPSGQQARQGVLDVLDDAALRRWVFRARDALGHHRQRLDALNVYPVPDGDTGTNLYLTLDAGVQGLIETLVEHGATSDERLGIVDGVSALARAALFSARGNSGVILSQLIAGLAEGFTAAGAGDVVGAGEIDGVVLARGLAAADVRARRAVAHPVEGTILTVIRRAAEAAAHEVEAGRDSLVAVVDAVCEAAQSAVTDTPHQLNELERAGVVDAGAAGLSVLFEALRFVVSGQETSDVEHHWGSRRQAGAVVPRRDDVSSAAFEVMYLLDGLDEAGAVSLRDALSAVGTSVVVAGDVGLRTVHVHTDDPGRAVEVGLAAGRPYGVRITTLADAAPSCDAAPEVGAAGTGVAGTGGPEVGRRSPAVGVVACVQPSGLVPLIERTGAVVVPDAPGRRVTPAQLLDAAARTGAAHVVVLPNDPDAVLSADAARGPASERGIELSVIETSYVLQGLAALAVLDPTDPACVDGMREAAAAVRCGFVATATSAALTDAGEVRPGDVLGFVGERVAHVGTDIAQVAVAVVTSLREEESELVTIVEGATAGGLADAVAGAPGLEDLQVEILSGGQAVYDLLIGVE